MTLHIRGNESLLLWGTTAVVLTIIIGIWQHRRRRNSIPTKWHEVGTLSNLELFPLKSGVGIPMKEAMCTQYGLQTMGDISPPMTDRCFMVYGDKTGEFKTARTYSHMVSIKLIPDGEGFVTLSAPNMPDIKVKIPNISEKCKIRQCMILNKVKISALDCGDEVASWLSKYILDSDNGCRLGYYVPDDMPIRAVAEKYKPLINYREIDTGAYPDLSSYNLMTQSSVDDLQTKVPPRLKVTHRQFRPNFIVKGTEPYAEDNWQWIRIGENAVFRAVKPCTRCVLPTIDPDTGIMDHEREPVRTLRKYRVPDDPVLVKIKDRDPVLGMHYGIHKQGIVRVGDKIYVGETPSTRVF